jgi:hypothetical protein
MVTVKAGEVVSISVDEPKQNMLRSLRLSEAGGGISDHRRSTPTVNKSRRLRRGLLSE